MADRSRRLNDSDLHLLKKIFEFSGYTTCPSINIYKTDRDISNNRRFLYKLIENGYLKEHQFYSDSRRDTIVYQVTSKTCNLFHNPGSYFRKKHPECYIIRALIKQHFFFEICKDFEANIVSVHEDRVNLLTNELDFDIAILPKKRDGDTCTTHVEETILDVRGRRHGYLTCDETGSILFDFEKTNRGIILVYIDKSDISFYKQLMSLYEKYKAMIDKGFVRIDFLIVVDNGEREAAYKEIIGKYFKSPGKKIQGIHESYIKLHLKILHSILNISPDRTQDLPERIRQRYSRPQELMAEDFEGIPVRDIQVRGIKAVEKAALDVIGSFDTAEEKLQGFTEFFRKIYKLYSAGQLTKDVAFGIEVYQIGHRFSL